MKPLRIYIDTSVFGGYYDSEFSKESILLFEKILQGCYQVVISDLTMKELYNAPENVKGLLNDLKIDNVETIVVTEEEVDLAAKYISEKVVGQASLDDCIHIATATTNHVDLLVSWNFKHIVNVIKIRGYNSVNIKNGYQQIEIRSPKDLIYNED